MRAGENARDDGDAVGVEDDEDAAGGAVEGLGDVRMPRNKENRRDAEDTKGHHRQG